MCFLNFSTYWLTKFVSFILTNDVDSFTALLVSANFRRTLEDDDDEDVETVELNVVPF